MFIMKGKETGEVHESVMSSPEEAVDAEIVQQMDSSEVTSVFCADAKDILEDIDTGPVPASASKCYFKLVYK